ncbi:MAG: tetratricopeptide repeat protein [Planctomycetaceae bacterium]
MVEKVANHPQVAVMLHELARLLRDTNRLEEAEEKFRRALEIDESHLGEDHPQVEL